MNNTLSRTIECKKCGCISFPDATLCPKCGARYEKKLEVTDFIDLYTIPNGTAVSGFGDFNDVILWSHYQFNCPIHGNISVEASVIATSVKCPFCRF
ncbi:hypothetical protein ACFLYM_01285 [Chloroflexota bacterium]